MEKNKQEITVEEAIKRIEEEEYFDWEGMR